MARVHAGKLDDFEKTATEKKKDGQDHSHDDHDDHDGDDNDDDDGFLSIFTQLTGALLVDGWNTSLARTTPAPDSPYAHVPLRAAGDPLLPMLRLDVGWQYIDDDIQAVDTRVEAGFGPLALAYRHTHYMESHPDDTLDLGYAHALYRISPSHSLELDLGLGAAILHGNETNAGFSVALPVTVYTWKHVGVRFTPTWSSINGNWISDYDGAVHVSLRHVTFIAGYRYVEVRDVNLDGPYCGVSFHY